MYRLKFTYSNVLDGRNFDNFMPNYIYQDDINKQKYEFQSLRLCIN